MIQNASVMGAVGKCGLQLYSYGQCVSLAVLDGAVEADELVPEDRI